MNFNLNFADLNQEERELVKNHLKTIRNFLLETAKNTGRPVRFSYDFGDPRIMGDGCLHEKTRSLSVRGYQKLDGTIEYEVLGSSGCLTQCLAKEDQNEYGRPAAGWQDNYALQLLKYWEQIKKAFISYIDSLNNASGQLQTFQL